MADRLLRHPVPYLNESIGSYLLRLCSENSCEVNQIADLIGFKLRGIDNFYIKLNEKHISNLSEITGIDINVIEEMTFKRFCFDKNSDYNRLTSSVCPICYNEEAYERVHWKNELIKVCLDHEIYLVDECPRCKGKITCNILFNGKCDCGLHIKDIKDTTSVNKYVLHVHNVLYQIFNIKSKTLKKEYDLLYNTLPNEDYCNLLSHLLYIAKLYSEDLYDIDIFFDNNGVYKNYIIASWVMLDWPVNLVKFLNILYCLDIKYINRSSFEVDNDIYTGIFNDRYLRIFNPLECLKLNKISYLVLHNKGIYQPMMNYFYDHINKAKVKRKMYRYIYLNNYVELDMAFKIFFDNSDDIRSIPVKQ